jgi:hypothetical protein
MAGEFRGRGAVIGVGEAATGDISERRSGEGDNCNGSPVMGRYN